MSDQTDKHAFIIMVGASHIEAAKAVKSQTLARLARRFENVSFEMGGASDDLVDGKWLLIADRGKVGDGVTSLRPMPPDDLYRQIDAMLDEMRFLEAPTLH